MALMRNEVEEAAEGGRDTSFYCLPFLLLGWQINVFKGLVCLGASQSGVNCDG